MKIFPLFFTIALTAAAGLASADDGAITNKNMSRTIKVPTFDQDIVNSAVSEAEHAFTDMMGFYVPAQAASGLVGPIDYCDIDNQPAPGEDCTSACRRVGSGQAPGQRLYLRTRVRRPGHRIRPPVV